MSSQPTEEPIYTYTGADAENDGILVQTSTLLPEHNGYEPHLVSHITTNLLATHDYFLEVLDETGNARSDYRRANIIDLLNQAGPKISATLKEKPEEWLVTGITVESPNGQKFEAWAQLNEEGRWTLMVPEDY